jgi:hypothetical protein
MSFIVNLQIVRGTTFGPYQILCKQADGTPAPLAGYTAKAEARKSNDDSLALNLAPTIAINDTLGIITIPKIPWATTAALTEDLLKWDLILIEPDGDKLPPFVYGEIEVSTPITQTP